MQPNEAIRKLQISLRRYRPETLPKHLPVDLADLTQAIPDEEQFRSAVSALADAIELIHRKRERIGHPLIRKLVTWYRYSFGSEDGVDLIVVYQPLLNGGVKLLGFGHRHLPHSLSHEVGERLP